MLIDKSWMKIENRLSREFRTGLQAFIEHAKNFTNSVGQISCPCKKCLNGYMHMPNTVCAHIHDKGIEQSYSYTTWFYHGETLSHEQTSRSIRESDDEMAAVVNDFLCPIADMTQLVTHMWMFEDAQDDIANLTSKLHEELYPGCTKSSTLQFLAELMHLKVLYMDEVEMQNINSDNE